MKANGYTFNTPDNWKRIFKRYPLKQFKYIPKFVYLSITGLVTLPFQWIDQRYYRSRVLATELHEEPLFIMGFWRTGTTHLHALLIQDERYAYVNNLQGLMPASVVSGGKFLSPVMQLLFPKTRPMDNIAITPYAPQEEDIAMMNLTPHTFYHYVLFPTKIDELFERYILMEGLSEDELNEWRNTYLYLLRSTTYIMGKKPLALKNPPNIARIPELVKLFPKAHYVEIRRDPLTTWLSYIHLHHSTIPTHNIEDFSWDEVEKSSMRIFERTTKRWFEQRHLIPEENLAVIKYEDLVDTPIETLRSVYKTLGLSDKEVVPRWESYLNSIKGYKRNAYTPTKRDIDFMRNQMAFLYEAWDYPLPDYPNE
jgi:hypothetical protein